MSSDKRIKGYFLRVSDEGIPFKGYIGEFEDTLKYLQKYVGGYIDVIALDNGVDLVINDEGKINGLPINRAVLDDDGKVIDLICGNILCVRHDAEGEFVSVLEEDIPVIENNLAPLLPAKGKFINMHIRVDTESLPEYKETD